MDILTLLYYYKVNQVNCQYSCYIHVYVGACCKYLLLFQFLFTNVYYSNTCEFRVLLR